MTTVVSLSSHGFIIIIIIVIHIIVIIIVLATLAKKSLLCIAVGLQK